MKPKSTELSAVIVTHHECFKKLQPKELNIKILNKHYIQTGINYRAYKNLTEIEIKKIHAKSIHQIRVWKN